MDVNYFLDYYEPNSFKVTENRLYTVASLGILAWASVMVANPLPMAFAGVLVGAVDDKTKTHDVRKVRISEDSTFPTLTKQSIADTLASIKDIVHTLEQWNSSVYVHTWKDTHLKEMMSDLSNSIKESGYNNSNARHFRNYLVALVSIMSKSYTKLHTYGFDVVNAAISYAEKSARQYR
jgi:uncharacterized protein (UPF0297 family)